MVPKTHHMSASYSSGYDTQYPRCDDKSELAAPVGTGSASLECGKLPGGLSGSVFRLGDIVTCADQVDALDALQREIIQCERCPRLLEHCRSIAATKRHAYRHWDYWGRPVPSFGDPRARLLLVGLAPGAHGANRTGRVFTGDGSGDFLYDALHETGFASQPTSTSRGDGLTLTDCYIASAVRCAPPQNKPAPAEFAACRGFLARELGLLRQVRAVLVLGRLALDTYLALLQSQGMTLRKRDWPFVHGGRYRLPGAGPALLCSYHPSRQNTQTGRLTKSMMVAVLELAKETISED